MSEVEVKQDPMAQMQAHLDHLFREVSLLREEVRTSVNSRRGLPGIQGERGPAGADAVIKIVQEDGNIKVLDSDGVVQAEIISVPGPVGPKGDSVVGPKGDSVVGPKGDPGVSPDVDEVVAKVVKQIGARLVN